MKPGRAVIKVPKSVVKTREAEATAHIVDHHNETNLHDNKSKTGDEDKETGSQLGSGATFNKCGP